MGFDCSDLVNAIVKVRRPFPPFENDKKTFRNLVVKSLLSKSTDVFNKKAEGSAFIHTYHYRKDDALQVISKIKEYWTGEREPTSTSNANKCRACSFKSTCKSSLV